MVSSTVRGIATGLFLIAVVVLVASSDPQAQYAPEPFPIPSTVREHYCNNCTLDRYAVSQFGVIDDPRGAGYYLIISGYFTNVSSETPKQLGWQEIGFMLEAPMDNKALSRLKRLAGETIGVYARNGNSGYVLFFYDSEGKELAICP